MKHLLALLCISSVLLVSCKKEAATTDTTAVKADSAKQANIASYNSVMTIFNSGKMDDLNKYIAEDYKEHTPWPGQKPGLAGLKEGMTEFRTAFPDMKFTVKDITSDGDMIWAHYNMSGTNTGAFMGMPATGKKVDVNGMELVKLTNGKCTDHWNYDEGAKMMQQLGMMPPDKMPAGAAPAAAPAKKG